MSFFACRQCSTWQTVVDEARPAPPRVRHQQAPNNRMKKTFTSLLLLSFVASSLALYSFPGTAYAATTFTFVASGSGDSSTITIPGTPTAGDLVPIWDFSTNSWSG